MEIINLLLENSDPLTLSSMVCVYFLLGKKIALIKKDVEMIDKAVNNRAAEEMTLSQEVSVIFKKISTISKDLALYDQKVNYVKEQITLHREVDEKTFEQLAKDINNLACKFPSHDHI